MQTLIDLANRMQDLCSEGTDLKQFDSIVRMIDARGKFILDTLKFDPNALSHVELFAKNEEEQLRDVQEIEAHTQETPEAAVPYVVNAYCRSISDTVRRDLLAFATDFVAGTTLHFRISFSSFAISFSSYHKDTEKKRIQARMEEMRNEGYVIDKTKRKAYVLKDCDINRDLLRAYCLKTFGFKPWDIITHDGVIDEMSMVMQYERYLPVVKTPEEPQAQPSLLTADGAIRLSKAISDVKFAAATYSAMAASGNGNLPLSCLCGHIYEIENVTGVHASIWKAREKEVADIRKKNQQIRAAEEDIQKASIEALAPKMRDLIGKARENMDNLVHRMGMYLDDFSLREYNRIDMKFSSSCTLFQASDIELDGKMMDGASVFYVYNTEKDLRKILETIEAVVPSATLESYEVKPEAGVLYHYIKSLHIRTSVPMDMMRILQMEVESCKQ